MFALYRCSAVRTSRLHAHIVSGRIIPGTRGRPYHETSNLLNNDSSKVSANLSSSNFVLYDSLSQTLKEVPIMSLTDHQKALAWYTCGPTTYSSMHLGHARTYVWFDMMRRVLEFVCASRGVNPPLFVMNITDVDDKIIAAAAESNESAMTVSRKAESNFWKDMKRLNCLRPHIITRVSEYVESDIVPYIERLVEKEMAYVGRDGVYFDVKAFEDRVGADSKYGKLAGRAVDSQSPNDSTGQQTSLHSDKRDRRDFALWKLRKEGEDIYWQSLWGEGRPGWHIECSAMIEAVQKQFCDSHEFLIHAGGVDLKFPHHTNEIAQAEAYHYGTCYCSTHARGGEWIPHWVHTGHLMVKDDKMSKSLKNFLTVDELWFDHDPSFSSGRESPADDFRLWCLMGGSYGHREEYSRSKLRGARQNREKILQFLLDGEKWLQQASNSGELLLQEKRWRPADHDLFHTVQGATSGAYRALFNDMRGTEYVTELIHIAAAGSAYMRENDPKAVIEPLAVALQTTRNLLALMGFSGITVRAGLGADFISEGDSAFAGSGGYVVGGESAVVDELIRFRDLVRRSALEDMKAKNGSENSKAILKACDELRDKNMPELGVEIMDKGKDKTSSWRFCVPPKNSGEN